TPRDGRQEAHGLPRAQRPELRGSSESSPDHPGEVTKMNAAVEARTFRAAQRVDDRIGPIERELLHALAAYATLEPPEAITIAAALDDVEAGRVAQARVAEATRRSELVSDIRFAANKRWWRTMRLLSAELHGVSVIDGGAP